VVGYSGKPLAQKLGIKSGFSIAVRDAPAHYWTLISPLPDGVLVKPLEQQPFDLIHAFFIRRIDFENDLALLRAAIVSNGTIWISWPKKSSHVPTDLTETLVRDLALSNGLVDVKVCAVDDIWSALKLVIRLKDRIRLL